MQRAGAREQHQGSPAFTTQHSAFTLSPGAVAAAVTALAALVYLNALGNGLVWDDPIVLTRQLLAFQSPRDLVFLPRNIPQFSPDYYRPLTIVSYLIDRAIGGASPFVFHLSVVVYHVVATYLLLRVGLLLFAATAAPLMAAGLGAALFAVHPIHTESVAWGAGRSDVLACALSLAATWVYLSRGDSWRRALGAAALAFLAALAKETAVALFLLLPASNLLLRSRPGSAIPLVNRAAQSRAARRRQRDGAVVVPSRWADWLPFASTLVVYLALRQMALGSTLGPVAGAGGDALVKMIAAVGQYLGKLMVPVNQCAYISDLPAGSGAIVLIGGLLLVIACGALFAWRHDERAVAFLVLWIALTLAPSLAIVVKIPSAPMAERYLYLPSAGFCLLVGYGAARLVERCGSEAWRIVAAAVLVAVLSASAVATVRRNAVWRSNLSLWEDTAAKNVTDGLPMRSLGTAYQQLGDPTKASACFQRALQRRNDAAGLFTIYNNLGSLAMGGKQLVEAERYYRLALTNNPQAADALFNLGLIGLTRAKDDDAVHDTAWRREQAQQARQLFEQAQQLSPLDPDIAVALGQTLSTLDDVPGARAQFERALRLGLPESTAAGVRNLIADLK